MGILNFGSDKKVVIKSQPDLFSHLSLSIEARPGGRKVAVDFYTLSKLYRNWMQFMQVQGLF